MYKKIKKIKTKTIKEIEISPGYEEIDSDNDDEVSEGIDIILVDVPLMVRLLEYAREEAASDVELHNLATKLITKSNKWKNWKPLTMKDYKDIIPVVTELTPQE